MSQVPFQSRAESVLGGLVSGVSSGDHHAGDILQLAKNTADSGILGNLGNLLSGGSELSSSGDAIKTIFGDKLDSIKAAIASYAGISQTSSSSLLSLVGSAALATIGQHAQQNNINAGSLTHMLESQRANILSALPAGTGYSLSGILGLGSVGAAASSASSPVLHAADSGAEKANSGIKFLLPLFLAILAILLLLYFFKGCNDGIKDGAANKDTVQAHIDTVAASTGGFDKSKIAKWC